MNLPVRARALLLSVLSAYVAFAALVTLYGESPWFVARLVFEGTWGTGYGVGQVLFKTTPLLLTGLAVECALRAGLFNVGAEGQLAVGSLAAAAVGAHLGPLPMLVAAPIAVLAGAAAGAGWAAGPVLLKTRYGAHEVISTILMNRIADSVVALLLGLGLAQHGTVRTRDVALSARLPRLSAVLTPFRGSAVSVALLVAVLLVFLGPLFFRRARVGREIDLVGQGPVACRAAGIPVTRRVVQAFMLSGALAGAGSMSTVLGYKGYFEQGLGAGVGFTGIAVAMMGRRDPWLLLFAALLFGTLDQGGLAINAYVPKELMQVVTAAVIVAVAWFERRGRGTSP